MSWQGYAPPRPVVVEVGKGNWVKIILMLVVCGGIGGVSVVSAFVGAVDGGVVGRIVGGTLGAVFLLLGVLPLALHRRLTRPRRLVIEPAGVRWDDPRGAPWRMAWQEMAAVSVSTAAKVSGVGTGFSSRTTLVRLDLVPRDAEVFARHPEMRHLWEASGGRQAYRLPLGPHGSFVGPIDAGLRTFAPGLYRGVIDEGIAMGFRYT
jgi:hypothetical protein